MKKVKLTRGKYALVDDADFDRVNSHSWQAQPGRVTRRGINYVARGVVNGALTLMHRFILGVPKGVEVDHENFDTLDNRRQNIRPATGTQNQVHKRKLPGTSSKFKGVSWQRSTKKWRVIINIGGHKKYLGSFADEEQAALAYDEAAVKNFGQFAVVNFKEDVQ